jgi:hypothetical protein
MEYGILKITEGDATEPQTTHDKEVVVIPHCCNNIGAWGAGFVLALSKKWEEPEKQYRSFCERNKMAGIQLPILGKVNYAKINNFLVVANMIGQDGTVGPDNHRPVKYWALANAMREVVGYIDMIKAQTKNPVVIHCPKFGCALAGGEWEFVQALIEEIWLEAGIDVVVYEFVPPEMLNRKKKSLYRTDIVIWTEDNVFDKEKGYPSLEVLAREATSGDAYCTRHDCAIVEDIYLEEEYQGLNDFFFGLEDDEVEENVD